MVTRGRLSNKVRIAGPSGRRDCGMTTGATRYLSSSHRFTITHNLWEAVVNDRSISCCSFVQNQCWRRLLALLLWGMLWAGVLWSRPVAAHGGGVIDNGFTDHFEWLVSIDPYPMGTGQATITLLVFDLAAYDPVNDLQVTVALAAPGTTRPCCNPNELSTPIPLVIDPQIYPSDYSARINLDQPGEWALQFMVEGGERSFTTIVAVPVKAAPAGQAVSPVVTPDVAATSTVFARNVQQARQQNRPLPAPVSPVSVTNTSTMTAAPVTAAGPLLILGFRWWLWGIAALLPLLMGWLLLRTPQGQKEDE